MTQRRIQRTIANYDAQAATDAARFMSLTFAQAHPDLQRVHIQPGAHRILDVGAGAGRDAAALAQLGYQVTALEPSAALRDIGTTNTLGLDVRWRDGSLPKLATVQDERFDFILCNAVMMHLPPNQRFAALSCMAGLLTAQGRLYIKVRDGGVNTDERRVYPFPVSTFTKLAARLPMLRLAYLDVQGSKVSRHDCTFPVARFDRV